MMKKHLTRWFSGLLLCALLVSSVTPVAAAARFTDVPAGNWAAASIERCVSLKLFQGETSTRFGLGKPMTRAAFVVVLDRLFGWEDVTPETGSYADVQDTSLWYFTALETALANGAVTLQTETFRPNDAITREEMAVMLVRALGYGTIAGLAQELPMPFTDVSSNAGYIAMAYELGIVNGTSETTFSPDKTATREQAAVMLMRVYDKIHAQAPERTGILNSAEDLTLAAGYDTVAISAGRLLYSSKLAVMETMDAVDAAALRDAVHASGGKALLYVISSANVLRARPEAAAKALAEAVQAGGYDGLYLDIPELVAAKKAALTALAAAIRQELGAQPFYLAVEAPAWQGTSYGGYDYAALAAQADRLVARVASPKKASGDFPVAPVEPLEEVYYALGQLKDQMDAGKLCLQMTTTGSLWVRGQRSGNADTGRIQTLLGLPETKTYYSDRYACAYLSTVEDSRSTVVWYLDGAAAQARVQLAGFMGVDEICVSNMASVSPEVAAALQ